MLAQRIRAILEQVEARPQSFFGLLSVCTFTGIIRAVEEYLFFGEKLVPAMGVAMAFAYFHIALGLMLALSKIGGADWKRVQNAVYVGIFLGIFPPVIDLAVHGFGSAIVYRYYVEGSLAHTPLLFYAPEQGVPIGETITVWLSIALAGAYTYIRSQSVFKTSLILLAVYLFMLLQFAILPRLLVLFVNASQSALPTGLATQQQMARLALSFLPFWYLTLSYVFYLLLRSELRQLLLNRLPHFVPFALASLAGGHYSGGLRLEVYLAAAAILMMAATAAVQNDYFDKHTQVKKLRPEKCDVDFMNIVSLGLILWLILLGLNVALPLLVIAVASILYNYPQFRLRKIFPASLKIEGLWAAMAFLSGMLIYERSTLRLPVLVALALVFGGWSVVSAWKDVKDLRSDAHMGYRNLYTFLWLGLRIPLHRTHRYISCAVIICFFIPVLYAAITTQWTATVVLTVVGIVPIIVLSYHPGMRSWFRFVLLVFSAELVALLLFLRI